MTVLKATKHGKLQVIVPSSKSWKQHSCALLDNLYIFRNDDDLRAAETLDLEWITIEIVTVKQEPSPPVVFKIVDLLQSTETFLGCDSTKEVGEWILALRQAKTRKKGEVQKKTWGKKHTHFEKWVSDTKSGILGWGRIEFFRS